MDKTLKFVYAALEELDMKDYGVTRLLMTSFPKVKPM